MATNLALNLRIEPSRFLSVLNTHLHPIGLHPGGRSTNFQLSLPMIEIISSSVASFQKEVFDDDIASSYVKGSDFTLKQYRTQLEIESLEPSIR